MYKVAGNKKKKEVAFRDGITSVENLPFPHVLYPGFYGAFFAFQKALGTQACFCSCNYVAIDNYIKIKKLQKQNINSNPSRMYILDSAYFPIQIVEDLMVNNPEGVNVLGYLKFNDKLCHECNLQTPNYRYCIEMYGSEFKQNYGWYIKKQRLEWGMDPYFPRVWVKESCPEFLLNLLLNQDFVELRDKVYRMKSSQSLEKDVSFRDLQKTYNKKVRKIDNLIENEVRRKFGHRSVGEAWTSETILYYLVKKVFPELTILRHYRPVFMQGLELDIYVEELNLGIEYQGIQHYKPIKHWGGKEGLRKLQERDRKKMELCRELNLPLVYFEFNECLNEPFVRERLSRFL